MMRFVASSFFAVWTLVSICHNGFVDCFDIDKENLKFDPLNRNSSAGKLVGTIYARFRNKHLTYSIIDVIKDGQSSPAGNSWYSKAVDITSDDCSDAVLQSYPLPRKMFCIYHQNGSVYTTKYFMQNRPESGTLFNFRILYATGDISNNQMPTHEVKIFSNCDTLIQIYNRIKESCITGDTLKLTVNSNKLLAKLYLKYTVSTPGYISAIRINRYLSQYNLTKGEYLTLNVNVGEGKFQSEVKLLYISNEKPQIVYVKPPLPVKLNDDYSITLLKASTQLNVEPNMAEIFVMKDKDYCTDSQICSQLTDEYYTKLQARQEECFNIDEKNFYAKYGYCKDDKAPIFTKTLGKINWDTLTASPRLVFSNYVNNTEGKEVTFKIENVRAIYTNSKSITIKKHEDCTNPDIVLAETPQAFFCINKDNGAIYTTSGIYKAIPSYENFLIKVRIAVNSFPPRMVERTMLIYMSSVCRNTDALFRKVLNLCSNNPNDIQFTDVNSISSKSYDVNLQMGAGIFYIAGIKLRNDPQASTNGSIRFTLKDKTNNKEVTASYFYLGRYASFSDPLKHIDGQSYQLSLVTTGQNPDFNISDWLVTSVPKRDYCSLRVDCVDLYSAFQEEYTKVKTSIESKCEDKDQAAFKAIYGYCKNNPIPKIRKTAYLLDLSKVYVKSEVIPRTAQMYVTDENTLQFELISVTSNHGNLVTPPANVSPPGDCSQTYESYPKRFFCISKTTGKIYTTDAIKGNVKNDTIFNLRMRVTDDSVYPVRYVELTLTLTANDKCSISSAIYSDISKCIKYSLIQPNVIDVRGENSSYLFNLPNDFQVIIALQFRKDDLRISDTASRLSLKFQILFPNGTVSTNISIAKVSISSYEFSTVEVSIPYTKSMKQVRVIFIQHFANGNPSIVQIRGRLASLFFIENFQCETSCINKYNEWHNEAKKIGGDCEDDPFLYYKNFEVCTGEKPEFLNPLNISSNPVMSGQNISISNCVYHAPYQLTTNEWRKNNEVVKNSTVSRENSGHRRRRSILDRYPNIPKYRVEHLVIDNVKLIDEGSYVCVIKDKGQPNKEYKSQSVSLKLSNVAKTNVELVLMSEEWKDEYRYDSTSSLRTTFQTDVETKIKNKILIGDPGNLIVTVKEFSKTGNAVRVNMDIRYAGSISVRKRYCQTITKYTLAETYGNIERVFIKHHDCCLSESFGEENYKGLYEFPTTPVGSSSVFNCTYGNNGPYLQVVRTCFRDSKNNPIWQPVNISFCQPKTLVTKLLIVLIQADGTIDAITMSQNLSNIVGQGALTNTVDIDLVTSLLSKVIAEDASSPNVTKNVLNTVDGILDTDESILTQANQNKNTSTKILRQLDDLAAAQTVDEDNDGQVVLERKNLGLAVLRPKKNKNIYISSKINTNSSENLQMKVSEDTNPDPANDDVSISLPSDAIGDAPLVYSYVFKKASFFQGVNNISIQSNVISATVVNKTVANLTNNKVEIEFTVTEWNISIDLDNTCKFYLENALNKNNQWSSEGCTTIQDRAQNKVKCICDHLTNFAILLDVSQTGSNPLALQIITWIGCGISLAGLFFTIVTYLLFKKLRKKLPPKILISLSISLGSLLIIFLVGAEKTEPRIGCQIVSSLLQYFILSTFCWMAVEGLNLYRNFVKVFSGGASNTKFFIKASVFAWGLPLIITVATGAAAPDNLGPASKEHAQFCVVRGIPFFAAVLLPVVLILLGNMVVLVLVLRNITNGSQLVKDSKAEKNKKFTQARIAFACSVLLGLTWVFAILAIGEVRDFFQWMFCIFNSLQGFFIFVFYTWRSNEVRREWKVFFGMKSALDRTSTSGSSSRWHSKYISIYRLTRLSTRKKSRKEITDTSKIEPATEEKECEKK